MAPLADVMEQHGMIIFTKRCNIVFDEEAAGWRFAGNVLLPYSHQEEVAEIQTALLSLQQIVREHIESAVRKLSQRPKPDYRNSIKEAISAVEASVRIVTGRQNDTAGALFKYLQQDRLLHPALAESLSKLYGYACDHGGIRHSLKVNGQKVTPEEARFLLVTCSAVANFILSLPNKPRNANT